MMRAFISILNRFCQALLPWKFMVLSCLSLALLLGWFITQYYNPVLARQLQAPGILLGILTSGGWVIATLSDRLGIPDDDNSDDDM